MGSADWMIWRPVTAGYGTLAEVQDKWSLDDLMDSLEVLDVIAECEEDAARRAREGQT